MPRHLNAVRAKTRTVRCGGLSAHRRNTGWARGREDEEGVYKEDMMSSGQYPFTSSYKMMDELYSRRPNSRGGSLTMLPQASFHATLPSVWLSTNWREPPRVSSLAPRLVCPPNSWAWPGLWLWIWTFALATFAHPRHEFLLEVFRGGFDPDDPGFLDGRLDTLAYLRDHLLVCGGAEAGAGLPAAVSRAADLHGDLGPLGSEHLIAEPALHGRPVKSQPRRL